MHVNAKSLIMISMVAGSTLGGYVPALWGDSIFSVSSILCSALGGILGIWIGYKISKQL
jgi:hypothetical protein